MTRGQCEAAADRLKAMGAGGRAAESCIGPDRADLVLAGAAILQAVQELWPCERVRVADRGLREGILLSLMAEGARQAAGLSGATSGLSVALKAMQDNAAHNLAQAESANMKGDHLAGKYYVLFDRHYREEVRQLEAEGVAPDIAKKRAPLILDAQQMLLQWEAGDEEVMALWHRMNSWVYDGFNETYRTIGVDFDKFYYESGTYLLGKERVEEGLAKGVFFQKADGSVWVDLRTEGLDEKLVRRADGTSVYITQDLGTAELKYQDFHYDSSVYVIGDEQNYHMQVLQATLTKLGKPYAAAIHHLSYGMVDLPSGRMKSREGTVVDADELVADVVAAARAATLEKGKTEGLTDAELAELYHLLGLGALKYYLLKVDPKKRMLFNPEESVSLEGHTGPFIQYSYARIAAIRRKAAELGIAEVADLSAIAGLEGTERELVQELARYPAVVADAARTLSPAVVAQYAYDLAKAYNRFYAEVSIFQETDQLKRSLRVALSARVGDQIKVSLGLLGIQVPERM